MTSVEKEIVNFYDKKMWAEVIKNNRLLSDEGLLYLTIHFHNLVDKIESEDEDYDESN